MGGRIGGTGNNCSRNSGSWEKEGDPSGLSQEAVGKKSALLGELPSGAVARGEHVAVPGEMGLAGIGPGDQVGDAGNTLVRGDASLTNPGDSQNEGGEGSAGGITCKI